VSIFVFYVKECYVTPYYVEAQTKQEAEEALKKGDFCEQGFPEYSYDLDETPVCYQVEHAFPKTTEHKLSEQQERILRILASDGDIVLNPNVARRS